MYKPLRDIFSSRGARGLARNAYLRCSEKLRTNNWRNMHRKSGFSLGISNSNLACVFIGLQRSRKVKKKKKSKFRLSSTLSLKLLGIQGFFEELDYFVSLLKGKREL